MGPVRRERGAGEREQLGRLMGGAPRAVREKEEAARSGLVRGGGPAEAGRGRKKKGGWAERFGPKPRGRKERISE